MKLHLTLFLVALLFVFSNCDSSLDDGKYANRIAGDFEITSLTSQDGGENFNLGSKVIVTPINDATADITLDFVGGTDVSLSGISVSGGFDRVNLDRAYSNAVLTGNSNEPYKSILIRVEYNDDTFAVIEAGRD